MSRKTRTRKLFSSAQEAAISAQKHIESPQCRSASYRLAFQDPEFLLQDDLRPVRLQLEMLKPELILKAQHVESTVVVFGSARIVDPETAEARLVSAQAEHRNNKDDPMLARQVEIARRVLENSQY